jgi:hypothetical protein
LNILLGFVFVACQIFIAGIMVAATEINKPELGFKDKYKIKLQAMKKCSTIYKCQNKK